MFTLWWGALGVNLDVWSAPPILALLLIPLLIGQAVVLTAAAAAIQSMELDAMTVPAALAMVVSGLVAALTTFFTPALAAPPMAISLLLAAGLLALSYRRRSPSP